MEQKGKSVISVFLLLFLINYSFSQEYFLLEDKTDKYYIKSYELDAKALYGINKKINIYNILLTDLIDKSNPNKTLVLFSVLPNIDSDNNWKSIDLDTIESKILSLSKLRQLSEKSLFERFDLEYGSDTKYWDKYRVIIKKDGKYFTSNNCLLQFYAIRNTSDVFNQPYNTININQKINTIESVDKLYNETYPNINFHQIIPPKDKGFDRLRDRREFLSKKFKINNLDYYQFWTFTDWGQTFSKVINNQHKVYFAYERGIDRFLYSPINLIVGGSYDFYFYHYKNEFGIKDEIFNKNILEEKIMIANNI